MSALIIGIILFFGPHFFSLLLPQQRNAVRSVLGEGPFKVAYSLISVGGLVALGFAYVQEKADPNAAIFYEPFFQARHAMFLLVYFAFILIFANKSQGYISRFVRHPFSIGVALWSIGHLIMNGERIVVVIFSLLLTVAILDIILSSIRNTGPAHPPKISHDVRAIGIGTVLYLVFAFGFHPYVLQVPVIQ